MAPARGRASIVRLDALEAVIEATARHESVQRLGRGQRGSVARPRRNIAK
jgi:hypothetical protein